MKKRILAVCGILSVFMLFAFTNVSKNDVVWRSSVDETLYSEDIECTLILRNNGYVKLKGQGRLFSGKYDISGSSITIDWDGGEPETGFVRTVYTTSGTTRIKMVEIKGATFVNTETFVVKRR